MDIKSKIAGLGCLGMGIIGLIAVAVIGLLWGISWNNTTATVREDVTAQWANVESSYQRRSDLIPNIVSTAKKYAEFEQETLTAVIEARSKATSVNIDASNLSPENLAAFSNAQSQLSSGLGRLLATFEQYPNLKANENFKELINELERTENRINVERNRYNESAKLYNVRLVRFPGSLLANILGFKESAYFKADAGAEKAPKVGDLFE